MEAEVEAIMVAEGEAVVAAVEIMEEDKRWMDSWGRSLFVLICLEMGLK